MKTIQPRFVVAGLLMGLWATLPTTVMARSERDALAADIEELKKGQAEIKQELEEIRKLLTPKPPAAVVEALEGTVAVGSIVTRGGTDAPVTIVEFSDYQCPFCKRHVEQAVPAIVKDYVETGKVRYAFRDFPLAIHPLATRAAEAARCAGDQGKYWEMHDRLFAHQDELQPEKLPAHAKAIGLDEARFRACLDQGRHAAAVQADLDKGRELGIRGTPTIVIGLSDGAQVKNAVIIRGAHSVATFKAEIDRLLAPPVAAKP